MKPRTFGIYLILVLAVLIMIWGCVTTPNTQEEIFIQSIRRKDVAEVKRLMDVAFYISLIITTTSSIYSFIYVGLVVDYKKEEYEEKSDTLIGRVSLWIFRCGFISCIPTSLLAISYMGSQ